MSCQSRERGGEGERGGGGGDTDHEQRTDRITAEPAARAGTGTHADPDHHTPQASLRQQQQ